MSCRGYFRGIKRFRFDSLQNGGSFFIAKPGFSTVSDPSKTGESGYAGSTVKWGMFDYRKL
jgi:hypothetical protein